MAWLAGALGLAGYISARSFALWRAIKRERPVTERSILDLLEDCKMQTRVQTIIDVIVTDGVTGILYIGGTDRHRGGFWHGMIDDICIYDEALSAEEVAELAL